MSFWTDQRVEQLRELATEKLSVSAEPPHAFCGEPTADVIGGRPYCPYHAARSSGTTWHESPKHHAAQVGRSQWAVADRAKQKFEGFAGG